MDERAATMNRAVVDSFIMNTAMGVFATLIKDADWSDIDSLRECAQKAKFAAPFLVEAFGMIEVNLSETYNAAKESSGEVSSGLES